MTIDTANWMDLVEGSKLLSELSIPGTHDSGSRTPASQTGRLTTQTRTIAEQLGDGIRFLDIRVGYTNKEFSLYHEDVPVNVTFQSVLQTCKAFLALHPRETIIMSVKPENGAPSSGNTAGVTFQQRFDAYAAAFPGLFSQGNVIPKLGDVRGKIVLFRRFPLDAGTTTPGHGINAFRGFPDDATGPIHGPAELLIQDQFAQSGRNTRSRAEKFKAVTDLLDAASRPGNANVLYVNFVSAAGILKNAADNDFPVAIARDLNPMLEKYFEMPSHRQGRFGIVATDFETAARNLLVIRTNLPLNGGYWTVQQYGFVTAFGSAPDFAVNTSATPVVAIAATPTGNGYYLLTRDKRIFAFGDARQVGDGGPDTQAVSITVKANDAAPTGPG